MNNLKDVVKEHIQAIDNFYKILPENTDIEINISQIKSSKIIDAEWIKWCNLHSALNTTITRAKNTVSDMRIMSLSLNSNLKLEINQKNAIKRNIEILEMKIKPLEGLSQSIQNNIYLCQSLSRVSREYF